MLFEKNRLSSEETRNNSVMLFVCWYSITNRPLIHCETTIETISILESSTTSTGYKDTRWQHRRFDRFPLTRSKSFNEFRANDYPVASGLKLHIYSSCSNKSRCQNEYGHSEPDQWPRGAWNEEPRSYLGSKENSTSHGFCHSRDEPPKTVLDNPIPQKRFKIFAGNCDQICIPRPWLHANRK